MNACSPENAYESASENPCPEPLTEDLLQTLLAEPDPKKFIDAYENVEFNLSEYLNRLLVEKNLRRIDVIRKANINETFGYQIFSGDRNASRDKVLQLAFGMELDLTETQRLLKHAGVQELYCKNHRDSIIVICISKRLSLMRTETELYNLGERTIIDPDNA